MFNKKNNKEHGLLYFGKIINNNKILKTEPSTMIRKCEEIIKREGIDINGWNINKIQIENSKIRILHLSNNQINKSFMLYYYTNGKIIPVYTVNYKGEDFDFNAETIAEAIEKNFYNKSQ